MASISSFYYQNAQKVFDVIEDQFTLQPEPLVQLTKAFINEFKTGLTNYNQPMAMIPTFVTGVPNGTETGTFLALDLGGTNLRVCKVVLNGDKTFDLVQQKYKVSTALKTGEATALFDYLAESVDAFLTSHPTSNEISQDDSSATASTDVPLGLTFSFPVEQTALGSGTILTWTKGFSAKHAIGHDVVQLLQDAFDRKHLRVKCVALVNDTVGTLLSRSYTAGGCIAGAIFGTGTNGAYVEDTAKISKLAGTPAAAHRQMVINTEWGAFNNSRSHLPTTPFDRGLDRRSINPSFQAFEKCISGMYLGETVRSVMLALVDATPKPLLFQGRSTETLNKHYGIDTSLMSQVEEAWIGSDSSDDAFVLPPLSTEFDVGQLSQKVVIKLEHMRKIIMEHLAFKGEEEVSLRDAAIVRWICTLVARRAALLSGVAVAAVLIQTDYATLKGEQMPNKGLNDRLGVGVDGSLVENYPNFQQILRESLGLLVGEEVERRVDIGLAKDGSGVGAALCALMALKQL